MQRKDELEQTHDFIDGLNAGTVAEVMAGIITDGTARAVQHGKKTTMVLKIEIEGLKDNPGQVKVGSDLSFKMPNANGGYKSENTVKTTMMAHNPNGTVTLRPVGTSELFSTSPQHG